MYWVPEPPFGSNDPVYPWVENNIVAMAEVLGLEFSPLGKIVSDAMPEMVGSFESYQRRLARKEQKREEAEARQRENMERLAGMRRQLERQKAEARLALEAKKAAEARARLKSQSPPPTPARPHRELPPVSVRFDLPALALQETTFPLADLRGFFLRARPASCRHEPV